jgi:hypothetical protein
VISLVALLIIFATVIGSTAMMGIMADFLMSGDEEAPPERDSP